MINKSFDFIIIGAGLAGCALSHFLSKSGGKVLLLEAGSICSGTSAACAGRAQIIESESDQYLKLVINGFPNLLNLERELEIDLEWDLPGHLTLINNEEQWQIYKNQVQRLIRFDIPAEMIDLINLRKLEPALNVDGCLGAAYSQEGRLNPFKLCFGFANSAHHKGTEIITNSPVIGFKTDANRIIAVVTNREIIYGETVILATGAWTGKLTNQLGRSIPIKHTHAEALVSEKLPKIINHHIGTSGFYEAVHGEERTVTLGFGQHQNGTIIISNAIQPEEHIDKASTVWGMPAIAKSFANYFPKLCNMRIMRTWAAPSPFLPDFLPAIGWYPEIDNLYIACGFHLAIPTIPLLAEEMANQLMDSRYKIGENILTPYSPERFFSKSAYIESPPYE
jgi:glycine/D-amino acid oxidase-like deaminating enzyme